MQMVYVDPETGELLPGPPAAEALPEATLIERAARPVVQEVRPDGTVVADIDERFDVAVHAEIVDGELVTCHRPARRLPEAPLPARTDQD